MAGTIGGSLTETIITKKNLPEEKAEILLDNFNDAGLFLQKVNLVRDIKKDLQNRDKNFWPLKSLELKADQLLNPEYQDQAMEALGLMLADIKRHIPGLVDYFKALPDSLPGYKRFFSVNNALGLATIKKMEGNPDIFYGEKKVKVPKWEFSKILITPRKAFLNRCEEVGDDSS